jgi:nucleotide-binding universal stress UspA family protein
MYPIKRILIPTDLSLCAEAAFRHGLFLAERFRAQVHLLHLATQGPTGGDGQLSEEVIETVWPDKVLASEAHPRLERWRNLLIHRELRCHADPAIAILEYAEACAADLIVIGTHGDHGTDYRLGIGTTHPFVGQTAERVVRHAGCPVITVAMGISYGPDEVRRLLVPIDFEPVATLSLAWAKDLAAFYGARLDLLHVMPPSADHMDEVQAVQQVEEQEDRIRHDLVSLFEQTKGAEVSAGFHVVFGRPDREILAFARQHRHDLIVLGAHADPEADALGHVTERVFLSATCSLLLVRHKAFSRVEQQQKVPYYHLAV